MFSPNGFTLDVHGTLPRPRIAQHGNASASGLDCKAKEKGCEGERDSRDTGLIVA
jgi:hypothetical protein